MKQALLSSALAAGVFLAFGEAAQAAQCADRDAVHQKLVSDYKENPTTSFRNATNHRLDIYTSRNSRTWSILLHVRNSNMVCLAASGKGKRQLKKTLGELHSKRRMARSGLQG